MQSPDDKPLDPEAAAVFNRVRRIMLVSMLFTGLAIAVVLGIVGMRVYRSGDARAIDATAALPAGARVISTAVAGDRIAVTVEVGGKTEVLLFDLHTLQARGRLRFE